MPDMTLKEADKLEITVLVDNYTDLFLLQNDRVVKRPPMPRQKTPLAEHGLSLLIEITSGATKRRCLMDAALTPLALLNNMEVFSVSVDTIEGIALSHGHLDHFGGLMEIAEKTGPGTKLIIHPDAFLPRRFNIPGLGPQPELPRLDENGLLRSGLILEKSAGASTWFDDLLLVTGEVERLTGFETGFLWAEAKTDSLWSVDPFNDDQGVAVLVKNRGLVVLG